MISPAPSRTTAGQVRHRDPGRAGRHQGQGPPGNRPHVRRIHGGNGGAVHYQDQGIYQGEGPNRTSRFSCTGPVTPSRWPHPRANTVSLKGRTTRNNQAAQLAQHDDYIRQLLETVEEAGIEENTLLVWVSDNGPMYSLLAQRRLFLAARRQGRGVRGRRAHAGICRMARHDRTRAATVGYDLGNGPVRHCRQGRRSREDKIPSDRIIDGIDQLPLLLNGEGNGRRELHVLLQRQGPEGRAYGRP